LGSKELHCTRKEAFPTASRARQNPRQEPCKTIYFSRLWKPSRPKTSVYGRGKPDFVTSWVQLLARAQGQGILGSLAGHRCEPVSAAKLNECKGDFSTVTPSFGLSRASGVAVLARFQPKVHCGLGSAASRSVMDTTSCVSREKGHLSALRKWSNPNDRPRQVHR
jgi:hypothetical protein